MHKSNFPITHQQINKLSMLNGFLMVFIFIVALFYMYKVALDEEGNRLRELAQSQSKIIEAVSQFDYNNGLKENLTTEQSWELTLSQFKQAHASYKGFGDTGEFTLAKKVGTNIVFLLSHRHENLFDLSQVTIDGDLAKPMQMALKGNSGILIGKDYRGEEVLAAYEPVLTPIGSLGIVAKIDLKEIQEPFKQTIIYSLLFLIIVLIAVALFFYRVTFPIVNQYQKDIQVLDQVFENSSTFITILDENANIIQFNNFAEKLTGYNREEVLGRNWFSLFIEESEKKKIQIVFNHILNDIASHNDTINKIKTKDGSLLSIRWRNSNYLQEDKKYIISIGIDITEALKLETKYSQLYSSMREGYGETDLNNNIIDVNEAFCEMLGYTKKELLGMKLSDITPKKWLDYELNLLSKQLKDNDTTELYEKEYLCKDGTLLPVELRVYSTKDGNNKAIGYWAIIRDISDRKKVQQELMEKEELMMSQSRSAAMGDMISMIAHQWKQPLTALSMAANSLKADYELDTFETKNIESYYLDINRQVQHLSQTIDDFRDFFKPNKVKQLTSIQEVIDDSLNIIEKSLENNNIELIKDFQEVGKVYIFPNELFHILINLVNNAKEALVSQNITNKKIFISSYKIGNDIYITIEDNAGGISEKLIDKIFEPYFTTKEKLNGTGIGLYMVKTIIEKHFKGEVEVENTNQGAKFILRIPS